MVTTPWASEEIPMAQAAELGTKKIMEEHCSVGIVMTTDGSINDIPREDFVRSEQRAIEDMLATEKPFLVLVNSSNPTGGAAQSVKKQLEEMYGIRCLCVNCLTLEEHEIKEILTSILYEFPLSEIQVFLPGWFEALSVDHEMKRTLFDTLLSGTIQVKKLREAEEMLRSVSNIDGIKASVIERIDLGTGVVTCRLVMEEQLFYRMLSEACGVEIRSDAALMQLLCELSATKRAYDKVEMALQQVKTTGYGIVMPSHEDMHLEVPQIVRKGSNYGVKLKASAPSIHMLRADIQAEITPIVGDEERSEDLLQYLLKEYENDTEKIWDSNIFGKSVYELVSEGLWSKLRRMPEEAQFKLQSTLSRIINEGSSGLLCIIFA